MLETLRITNVALISEMEVSFGAGLNILSGETGAGKSIIIDSVNFVLGERVSKDFIRSGENEASVEALIFVSDDAVLQALSDMGIIVDCDNAILLFRSVNAANKNVCRVNGKTVTIGMLKEISALLVDVHGQHEHQSLLNPARHIELLDRFCGGGLSGQLGRLESVYRAYREKAKALKAVSSDEAERQAKIELYAFQVREIEGTNLVRGEDEALAERKRVISNAEKLVTAANSALELLYGGESGERSALDKLSKALDYINAIAALDESQQPAADRLNDIYAQLDDLTHDFRKYCGGLENDPGELDAIESRLDIIYKLRKKYGRGVSDILDFCVETKSKLEAMENSAEVIERLSREMAALEKEMDAACAEISLLRGEAAIKLQSEIVAVLKDLGMKDAIFEISVGQGALTANGRDSVEFLISANKGESLKPLSKIASGGEMSRVMLALKTALADYDSIGTFIFDEIDTGVSGRTAQQVAEKLSIISKKHQILCITHLPQIAATGDKNFLIEKKDDGGRTNTYVTELDYDNTVKELARLIGGAQITQTTLDAAREMKDLAKACPSSI